MRKPPYERVVEALLARQDFGHYNEDKRSVCLYDFENTPEALKDLKKQIAEHTTRYRVVLDNPRATRSNLQVLDIDV
jgi:hypothetical protein